MSDDWLSNPEATEHVKRVLNRMGIPLETRVARACRAMLDRGFGVDSVTHITGRLLYGVDEDEKALREVDQALSLQTYAFIPIDDEGEKDFTVSCELNMLIECKYREELAVFGFPYDMDRTGRKFSPPYVMASPYAHTDLLKGIRSIEPAWMQTLPCTIGLVDNTRGRPRPVEENLIYKASASLYDALRFSEAYQLDLSIDTVVEEMGLLSSFQEHLQSRRFLYNTWAAARSYLHQGITTEQYQEFFARFHAREAHTARSIACYVAVVCVDAPLYQVTVGEPTKPGDTPIEEIEPVTWLLTSSRIPHWPGRFRYLLPESLPEAPVWIVNIAHLDQFLDNVSTWFSALHATLEEGDYAVAMRAPLQMAFLESIAHSLTEPERSFFYR